MVKVPWVRRGAPCRWRDREGRFRRGAARAACGRSCRHAPVLPPATGVEAVSKASRAHPAPGTEPYIVPCTMSCTVPCTAPCTSHALDRHLISHTIVAHYVKHCVMHEVQHDVKHDAVHLHVGEEPFGQKLRVHRRGRAVQRLEPPLPFRRSGLAVLLCQDGARSLSSSGGERRRATGGRKRATGRQGRTGGWVASPSCS